MVEGLESHLGVRRATRGWGELVEGVVRPMALHSMAGMPGVPPGVTEEHLEHLLAIILSNQVSTGQGTSALFPVFPLLHRACLPTCRWWVEEGRVTVRVATQVDRGQRLTVAYRCKPPASCHLSPVTPGPGSLAPTPGAPCSPSPAPARAPQNNFLPLSQKKS